MLNQWLGKKIKLLPWTKSTIQRKIMKEVKEFVPMEIEKSESEPESEDETMEDVVPRNITNYDESNPYHAVYGNFTIFFF